MGLEVHIKHVRLSQLCVPTPETATRAALCPLCCGESDWSNQFLGWWV